MGAGVGYKSSAKGIPPDSCAVLYFGNEKGVEWRNKVALAHAADTIIEPLSPNEQG